MKVAVYAIALNEEQFVERWFESAKEADYLLIADTGSKDKTVSIAKKLGINVVPISITPWRFDDARNASLAGIPQDVDYCIALDMDEVLIPGWKQELEKAYEQNWTRPRYKYTWSWLEDGKPGLQYGGDKIHSRKGYRWKHPVHEVITCWKDEETQGWLDLEIHHYPDNNKSRAQYFPLLALSVKEDPQDDRNSFYYARELFFNNMLTEAAEEFHRYLSLSSATWNAERGRAYRYLAQCVPEKQLDYLTKSLQEDGSRRETYIDIAFYYYKKKDWKNVLQYVEKALDIKDKPLDYLCEDFAWGSLPYDLASISCYNLKNIKLAISYGEKALELEPTNERLKNNLIHYTKDNI
jgi:glycosyltransferase involved in cell wall biosynthesis